MNTEKPVLAFYCSSTSWGGLEMNFATHSSWLCEMGYAIHVFIVKGSPLSDFSWSSEISIHYIKRNKKYYDWPQASKISKKLKSINASVLWLTDTRDLSLAASIKKIFYPKVKLVYRQAMRLGVDKKDLPHTLRFSAIDKWISTLNYMAKEVLEKTKVIPNKMSVIPLGLDLNRFDNNHTLREESRQNYQFNDGHMVLGVLGRIDPLKGQLFVLQCFENLRKKHEHLRLLIVGEPTKNEGEDYLEKVNEFIESRGLSDVVVMAPFLKEKEKFYAATDIVVVSSKSETFGMVTIEAMACAKAIIGTDSAGTTEILGNGEFGVLYEPEDHSSFEDQFENLIEENERLKFGKKAIEEAGRNYSKEAWKSKTSDLIQSLQ